MPDRGKRSADRERAVTRRVSTARRQASDLPRPGAFCAAPGLAAPTDFPGGAARVKAPRPIAPAMVGNLFGCGTSNGQQPTREDAMARLEVRRDGNLQALSDAELVRLALLRDGEAFRAIMQRHNRRLYRVARSVVHDDSEAEDVVQEAYVLAFGNLAKFRAESSLA